MQVFKYVFKVCLSGLILCPVIYFLLLTTHPSCQISAPNSIITVNYILPYTFLLSIGVGLSIHCGIILLSYYKLSKNIFKLYLVIIAVAMIFAGTFAIEHIGSLMLYNSSCILAIAYSISITLFIILYKVEALSNLTIHPIKIITNAIIYSLKVWFFTFLLSSPFTLLVWFITQSFHPGSLQNGLLAIIDQYKLQLHSSLVYLVVLIFTTISLTPLQLISTKRKKCIIMLLTCPLSLPVYFYYLFFSNTIIQYPIFQLLTLVLPALFVSAGSIWWIRLKPISH